LIKSGDVSTHLGSLSQSIWSRLLIAGAVVVVFWLIYRLRVTQLARRIRSRMEQRARERERIACELHDTLLQDLQGLILRFQAVAERIPAEQEARAELEAALVSADAVVAQARGQAYDLRVDDSGDLCAALAEIVATTPLDPPIPVRLVVEGRARTLDPFAAAEVTRIVREALFDIAQYAQAPAAEITVGFEASHLAVRVRVYGRGIAEHVPAHTEQDGHFGMISMRKRADRIGGKLTINSSPDDGTEISLTLPAELAFSGRMARRNWISRLVRSSKDG
jgi:signal transduction histidine kinase